jgi:hypothetical protein
MCDHPAAGRAAGLMLTHEAILARVVLARHGLAPTPVVGLAPKSVVGLDPQGSRTCADSATAAHGPPLASRRTAPQTHDLRRGPGRIHGTDHERGSDTHHPCIKRRCSLPLAMHTASEESCFSLPQLGAARKSETGQRHLRGGAADPVLTGSRFGSCRAARAEPAAASWNRSDHRPAPTLRGEAATVAMPSAEAFAPAWHRAVIS